MWKMALPRGLDPLFSQCKVATCECPATTGTVAEPLRRRRVSTDLSGARLLSGFASPGNNQVPMGQSEDVVQNNEAPTRLRPECGHNAVDRSDVTNRSQNRTE